MAVDAGCCSHQILIVILVPLKTDIVLFNKLKKYGSQFFQLLPTLIFRYFLSEFSLGLLSLKKKKHSIYYHFAVLFF